jgi:glycosyltransferase involved in cell wall biosynthesis
LLHQHKLAGLAARQCAVVRNGIPLPCSNIRRERNRIRRFLLLTRLTVEKGVRVVLQTLASLPRTLEFELVIAGRGPLEQEVRQAAADDRRVQFVGYVTGDVKAALLEGADCLLIPSLWYENAPVTAIEAAAYGLAVVASRIGGLPELVDEGRSGLLFEPGDADGLAAIMCRLMDGNVTLPDIAIASGELAHQHSITHMVDAYLDCYEAVLSADRQPMRRRFRPSEEAEHAA